MQIKVLETIAQVKDYIKTLKKTEKSIGLVPTMGALHEGHLALMRQARETCDVVIASVFVNPTQFGPNEDFDAYPRTFADDCEKLDSVHVDAVFHPSAKEMYPKNFTAYVTVDGEITSSLCGAKRPGHFRGVATVVTKLIHITEADFAFFGQKDAQQVLVIQRVVRDLNLNVQIKMVPIMRAANGLALSSRNQYLSEAEKAAALVLVQSLREVRAAYEAGEKRVQSLIERIADKIQLEPLAEIDYVEIYSFPDLEKIETIEQMAIIALAVKFGKTRLIDNTIIGADMKCC